MKPRYVVDTNVLIAASAGNAPHSVIAKDATPDNPDLRLKVLEWLTDFQQSSTRLVLDYQWEIDKEYRRKMDYFNDFGLQVIQNKWDNCAVDLVDVVYDDHGHALLQEPLQTIVHDCSDRKMVAAAVEAINYYGETTIANASDSDWYEWEAGLLAAGVIVEQILDDWLRPKYNQR